jgi:hypothetical protein
MVITAHALLAEKIRLKSVSNERHFTLEAETVFRLYLAWHCSGVTQIYHMRIPAYALLAVHVRLKSVINEGHFTLEVEGVSRPYLSPHCGVVTEIWNIALPAHGPEAVQVRLKSVSNKDHFTLEAETFSSLSPRVLQRGDEYTIWHSLRMRYEQCKVRMNSSVINGCLRLRPKQGVLTLSPGD